MKFIVITSPATLKDEALICNALFARGLEFLHLRKPGAPLNVYEKFILQTEPCYRRRIILHEYYELVEKYGLGGIHLKSGMENEHIHYPHLKHISISCHSEQEIAGLPFHPAYCFLSPVFDSISKKGYRSPYHRIPDVTNSPFPVIALGGITPDKTASCRQHGFKGVAALGYIWEKPEEAVQRFVELKTPFVMSIAGFDPSSGAGIGADLKTFENCGSYGLGICSALTFQNEDTYLSTRWISSEEIIRQCELQIQKHSPQYVKIGLIENFKTLDILTAYLKARIPDIRMIWDPILKATAGKIFHENHSLKKEILERLYLITPNTEELKQLFGESPALEDLQNICRTHRVRILWKGGHNSGTDSTDVLITPESIHSFSVARSNYEKHGTGCVLSAAICAQLAQGTELVQACNKAQLYINRFIQSNYSLLGYHRIGHQLPLRPCPEHLSLQYITDPKEGMSIGEQVEAVCRGGIRWVQLRLKETDKTTLLQEGKRIKEICSRYQTLFIVNDQVQIARELDADGVHLGKEDMDPLEARRLLGPDKIIGATCNTWEDILLRARQQVDYIGLGPFTFTKTKKKLSPTLGLEGYKTLLAKMQQAHICIPVFAIGGITEKDIPELMSTGIQGIALSGLIKNSPDLTIKTRKILCTLTNIPK